MTTDLQKYSATDLRASESAFASKVANGDVKLQPLTTATGVPVMKQGSFEDKYDPRPVEMHGDCDLRDPTVVWFSLAAVYYGAGVPFDITAQFVDQAVGDIRRGFKELGTRICDVPGWENRIEYMATDHWGAYSKFLMETAFQKDGVCHRMNVFHRAVQLVDDGKGAHALAIIAPEKPGTRIVPSVAGGRKIMFSALSTGVEHEG